LPTLQRGHSFGTSGATVTVGGESCLFPEHTVPHTELRCQLPPGVGFNRHVVVTQGRTFSVGLPLLDYAPPTIERVTSAGCSSNGGTGRGRGGAGRAGGLTRLVCTGR